MDDAQVQSWRDGDAMAAAAVRNGLRAVADAIVTAPAGTQAGGRTTALARDPERRREVTAEVAREVMQRGGATAADLRALAVMVASRHVVEALREGRHDDEGSHLPPQMVVSMALVEGSLSEHAREVARRHVAECTHCAGDVLAVAGVVQRVTTPAPAQPTPDGSTAAEDLPTEKTRRPPAAEEPESGVAVAAAAQARAAAAQVEAQRKARPAKARITSARRTPPRRPAQKGRPSDPRGTVSPWRAAWPVLAIGAVVVVLFAARARSNAEEAAVPGLARIADQSVPEAPDPGSLPVDVDSAALDLASGNCRVAADRFRRARQRYPDDPTIAWYDGVSQVCAGNGQAATEAFDAYRFAGGESTPDLLYYQAQASLLRGDGRSARQQLLSARPLVDSKRGARIDTQLTQLNEVR